jgi:translation initiation factor 2-alpha kinase 4
VLFLNHSELLEILLRYCGIEAEQWKPVKDILSMINTESVTWKRIEKDLRNPDFKLPRASIQQLAQFNFQDDLQNAHKKLQKMLTSPSDLAKLQQMFTRLLEVQQHAETMKVETKIVINPLANYSERLYNGSIMFQCVDTAQKKMLAVGGRYDHLIHSLEPEVSTRGSPRAVGLRLNTTELANRLAPEMTVMNKSSKQEQKLQRCDVIITSFEEDTLHTTCLEIAADLWANSIRAELTDLYSSFEELSKAYKKDGQYLVLTVRQDSNAIGGVALRARALGKQEDDEIKRTELIAWLKDELKAPENDSGRAKLRRETSVGEQSLSVDTRSAEIVIIQPKHKGKKTNRQALADDAGLTVREEARGMVADAPIMVVEVNKEVLEAMRATRIDSAESWKAFLQACPAEETRYLKEVQEGLEAMKEGGKEGVWLYSSKIRACVYYSL